MNPRQALRYLERRMADAPATDEQTVTDELAFTALWKLTLLSEK